MSNAIYRMIITGGATGFGKALALTWAKNYHAQQKKLAICIADLHEQRGQETTEELRALGVDALFCQCDITNQNSIDAMRSEVLQRWQGVDIIINNAGVATGGSLTSETIEQWQWVFNINLYGMVRVCQTFVEDFRQQGHGYFVNVASQAGLTPIPLMASYNAVKSAVIAFSETLKLELASDNIDVSVVCPSFFKTNLDESMRTTEAVMLDTIKHLFNKADMTAEQVSTSVYQQAQQKKFLILTHKSGKQAYFMKRWLPIEQYLKKVIKQTAGLVKRAKQKAQEKSA